MEHYDRGFSEAQARPFTGHAQPITKEEMVEVVEAWRKRKVLCEEVDLIEQKGGNFI